MSQENQTSPSAEGAEQTVSENHLIEERRNKLAAWREQGGAFPNDFKRADYAGDLQKKYADAERWDKPALAEANDAATVAGRIMAKRVMGKAAFFTIRDMSGDIQLFFSKKQLEETFDDIKTWDIGDIIGASGTVFRTNTGELSIDVAEVRLLTKSLRPLPDKWHGLSDIEQRYRQRYVDLIVTPESRDTFRKRSLIMRATRNYLDERNYLEVETPMMQSIPGGASARPFTTHHNALDMTLYLRIAPELYLKRLVVGGFERVYEINRNFRNEGVSTRHNPEFTMLELYEAYGDFNTIMDLTEGLIRHLAETTDSTQVDWDGDQIDLSQPFQRVRMDQLVADKLGISDVTALHQRDTLVEWCQKHNVHIKDSMGWGKLLLELFEAIVEPELIQPTFVTMHPLEVSPLARRNEQETELTDRFELFIGGKEIANGFSELNDAEDQAERFQAQVAAKEGGDDEAMHYDDDYIRALEYGLPPTGGLGIGMDRLVMMLTGSASIRDVLFFPTMRPKKSSE